VGALEMIMAFAIKNSCFRTLIQASLILNKAFNLSRDAEKDFGVMVILGGVGLISIIFLIYHSSLDRENYKIISDSHEKLTKFQTILADDFPISVVIISSNLQHIFYSNQYFTQNFCQNSQSVEILFKKTLLEFDDTNIQLGSPTERVSLYTFITKTMNIDLRFNNRDVFNLYSLYQDDRSLQQHHYEIKLRKMIWDNAQAYTIIFNDVSDKQKITVLQEADEQRDRVIATITHELKTPINGILGLLDIVDCRSKDPVSKTYLDHCKNCSKLLLYLVNSIMDLSQLRQHKLHIEKTVFSLDELLKEMQSLYTFISEHRGLGFIVEKGRDAPDFIFTDKYRLINILVQLLGNAMKFTFQGFVKFKVEICKKDPRKLTFIIEDSGIGIREEDQSKLLSMFGQITEKKKNINRSGAGLGITIANEFVALLNDSTQKSEQVEYESEPGKGSVFKFCIDFTQNSLAAGSFVETSHPEREEIEEDPFNLSVRIMERNILGNRQDLTVTSRGSSQGTDLSFEVAEKKRVLLVDDNPFNLVAASFIVSKLGLKSQTAANGKEAIERLQESMNSGKYFSFILMDIQMPIMDGIQATKAINQMIQRKELYPVPVIALTAKKIDSQEKRIYKECGMFDALGKPLIEQELKNILEKLP
jgi:signal transduction histidine kinase/CheY-like chemotaxis protein